ncbi:sugar phosphate isomerase/epimerase [Paenibacillus athensensis]|uniref:Xylose isomerase-like TIM barrel domain-containing protein n=1 Tax=Paenibacillus athensensis TaxID=1967502 RepID=A0A4Y8Q569_9BACL|nr:sugar phosphate isomerase/epimerase family protein [Paenibacillus athensensis]MCD1259613.1 sugar phosphate isomerase/epimerase [Paenibacillus athensensis]
MKWTMTTVSFRYHLLSYTELLELAAQSGFQGIELWEPHLLRHEAEIYRQAAEPAAGALPVHVLSAYLNGTDFTISADKWARDLGVKLNHCRKLGVPVLRLFTGTMSSAEADEQTWRRWLERLGQSETLAQEYGVQIAFETHPGTLLDRAEAVDRFVQAIASNRWRQIGLNFDVFHVWEFGVPLECLQRWFPHVKHVHLKNAMNVTEQFAMANVYHPMGVYSDLAPLAEGVVDVEPVVALLQERGYDGAVTLEWFGLPSVRHFREEIGFLNEQLVKKGGATAS